MHEIVIESLSYDAGQLSVRVTGQAVLLVGQLGLDLYEVGVLNASWVAGLSAPIKLVGPCTSELTWAVNLDPGFYELVRVTLQTGAPPGVGPEPVMLTPGKDYERALLHVPGIGEQRLEGQLLAQRVGEQQSAVENAFEAAIDIRRDKTTPGHEFRAFVFLRDVLITTRLRFERFEVVPSGFKVESRDLLDAINRFFRECTASQVEFAYDDGIRDFMTTDSPVATVHFPSAIANSADQVAAHCGGVVSRLLLGLSLTRGAAGHIFQILVFSRDGGEVKFFSQRGGYRGNLLGGSISGESPSQLEALMSGLAGDPMGTFLAHLHKEAQREESADFKYVRYWQILETMAEGQNYPPEEDLLDPSGVVMVQDGRRLSCKGSVNIVYRMLREAGIANGSTWENVNVWFAFRNAVAHHGSVSRWEDLSRDSVREWGKKGAAQVAAAGHDQFLWELKEAVTTLVMGRLSRAPAR